MVKLLKGQAIEDLEQKISQRLRKLNETVGEELGFGKPPFRNALESVAFMSGLKPAIAFRIPYDRVRFLEIKEFCNRNNLFARHTAEKFVINSNTDYTKFLPLGSEKKGEIYVCISSEKERAEAAAKSFAKDVVVFGRAMGYPECCLEFGGSLSNNVGNAEKERGDFVWSRARNRSYRNSEKFSQLLNVFSGFSLIPHVPCHLDCAESKKYAKKMLALIRKHDSALAKDLLLYLKIPSLFWNYCDYILFDGTEEKGALHYSDLKLYADSPKFFSLAPDYKASTRAKEVYGFLKKGNNLKDSRLSLEVFQNSRKTGTILKEKEFEFFLANPQKRKIKF
ncbi:MAG: hypothetical protein NT067_05435 [Candidatus Diapherotrites archaeon]|nr:hypothetical protein [Candidatus Diapherotrites archaeon]